MTRDIQKSVTRTANQPVLTMLSSPRWVERKLRLSGSLPTHAGVLPVDAYWGTTLATSSAPLMAANKVMTVEREVRNLGGFTCYIQKSNKCYLCLAGIGVLLSAFSLPVPAGISCLNCIRYFSIRYSFINGIFVPLPEASK